MLSYSDLVLDEIERRANQQDRMTVCPFISRSRCNDENCVLLHFELVEDQLSREKGFCSFLEHCTSEKCEYMHVKKPEICPVILTEPASKSAAQYLNVNVLDFDFSKLGFFDVIMLDPPWRIAMELPYPTLSDQTMAQLPIGSLIHSGVCALWVTGRTFRLGQYCLQQWGFTEIGNVTTQSTIRLAGNRQ
ncbi:hypothetical protein PCE1_003158 [Barthelona sp. PCE]